MSHLERDSKDTELREALFEVLQQSAHEAHEAERVGKTPRISAVLEDLSKKLDCILRGVSID